MIKLLTGSTYFFKDMPGFIPNDLDYIILDADNMFNMCYEISRPGICMYFWKRVSPEEFVDMCIKTQSTLFAGSALNKEFCNEIGLNIEHLKQILNIFNHIDKKHLYVKLICDFYIKNNNFELTKELRELAYDEYKKERIETFYNRI